MSQPHNERAHNDTQQKKFCLYLELKGLPRSEGMFNSTLPLSSFRCERALSIDFMTAERMNQSKLDGFG